MSTPTNPHARPPQRKRGHERVAALLAAGAACFADKGYDAATMTEIAARAGASIGSLYQFFPTKEALAEALVAEDAEALYASMERLVTLAAGSTPDELATRLLRMFVDFRRRHPAHVALLETPGKAPLSEARSIIRQRLRDYLSRILALHAPGLAAGELRPAAMVVQQMMKAGVALQTEQPAALRQAALAQLQRALALYLHTLANGGEN